MLLETIDSFVVTLYIIHNSFTYVYINKFLTRSLKRSVQNKSKTKFLFKDLTGDGGS